MNFKSKFRIVSSSVITNLDVSHNNFEYEQSEDMREVRLYSDSWKYLEAKDIVISFSTE